MWVQSLGQKRTPEEGMATTPVFMPGDSHGTEGGFWQAMVHCKAEVRHD